MRLKGFEMRKRRPILLVAQSFNRPEELDPLKRFATIYWLQDLDEEERKRILPQVEVIYSHGWPKALDPETVSKMKSLRFYQAGNAGVNAIPFRLLDKKVKVCSNAGAYSDEV